MLEFLWWDREPTCIRVRRKAIIGTIQQYPSVEDAWQGSNGLRVSINQARNRQPEHAITIADLIDHYSATLGELLADVLQSWHQNTLYAKPDDWVFPSTKMKGRTPLSASMMAKDKIRPAAIRVGIRLEHGQRFGFHNFRHSLATFLINKGKDVKTIQGLLRHAKASTTLDLYSQAIDESKMAAQRNIALAITGNQVEAD